MRCDDFLTEAEIAALGLDTSDYDAEGRTVYQLKAVICQAGMISFQVHADGRYSEGIRKSFEDVWQRRPETKEGLEVVDGPKYGSDTLWILGLKRFYQVHFVAGGKGRSGTVNGGARADVEKLAEALAAKL